MFELLTHAVSLHQSNRLAEAIEIYEKILSKFPEIPEVLHLLGLARHRIGESSLGIKFMEKAVEKKPQLSEAHFNLANAYFETGRFEEAESTFRIFLHQHPKHSDALSSIGRLLLRRGALDEAEEAFESIDKNNDMRRHYAQERIKQYRQIKKASEDMNLPPGIVVRGVFRDSSGYAYLVRQFVRSLVSAGVKVHLMDLCYGPTDNLDPRQMDPLFEALSSPVRAKAVLNFTTPIPVESVPGLMTVVYSMFEATRIPNIWAAHSRHHDHTIVTTPSSRDAWIASGHPADRISVCPAGVDPVDEGSIAKLEVVDALGRHLSSYATRILNISDFNDRKNLRGLLRTWFRNTRAEDPAALVLKVGKAAGISNAFRSLLGEVVSETGINVADVAPIFLIDDKLSDQEMTSLLSGCTHYWSMSHGEGWDLPMAQAGAMGLTLIAPQHSAYAAYLSDHEAYLLPCSIKPAVGYYAGLDWWHPNEVAAGELLSKIIRSPADYCRSAQHHLRANFNWEASTGHLIKVLSSIGAIN